MDKVIDTLLMLCGLIGVVFCIAGIVTFGFDINKLLNSGHYAFSSLSDIVSQVLPGFWFRVVQFSRMFPPESFITTILNFLFDMAAMLFFLIVGGIFMYFGFRMRRYRVT